MELDNIILSIERTEYQGQFLERVLAPQPG